MSDSQNTTGATAPAPRKRTGITVLLYVLLALTIVASLWALSIMNKAKSNPLVTDAVAAYENLIKDMDILTQSQIEQQGEHLSVADLLANPESVKGRYVVIDGEVQTEESNMVNQNMAIPNMVVENLKDESRGYVLGDGLVLVDISGDAGPEVRGGDYVRGYGAVLVVNTKDVFSFPIVGPDLEKEFGSGVDDNSKVVFLFSKGMRMITADEAVQNKVGDAPTETAPSMNDAGIPENPCAAANPCNPCAGATPPVDGRGEDAAPENPCGGEAAPPADPPAGG